MKIGGFIGLGMVLMAEQQEMRKEWKERILNDWEKTIQMPRKMKKKRRKHLMLEFNIASYDPFNLS